MKKLSVLLFSVLLSFSGSEILSQDYWQRIPSPTDKLLRNLFFVDSLTGWCAGQEGTIIHTTDGGSTWEVQNSTVETFIVSVFFLDENVGWALTIKNTPPFGTIILNTTNGGDQWNTSLYPEENIFMNTVFYFDSLNGFLGGSYIAGTTDGGVTWQNANVDSNMISGLPVHNFSFYNRQFGYACGGFIDLAGVIWKTTDYGLNWSAVGVSPDQIFDLFVIDSLNAITLSGDPEGFFGVGDIKTTDAGETWSYNELSFFALSFAIDFRTVNEAWSASGFKFLYTSDNGEEWIEKSIPDSAVIFNLQFTDSSTGYAVGENGAILKYLNKTNPPIDSIPSGYNLNQNYPNPFNGITTISWKLNSARQVKLSIFNSLGENVETLINEFQFTGNHSVVFRARSTLPSGIYFYQIQADNFIQTRGMVLLK